MRWRRLTFWFSLITLSLLVLALSWLWTADLGVFKPQVERFVSEKTGRGFRINGNFLVDLGNHSVVIAEDVHFANAAWADEADMVSVGRIEVRLDLWSLVNGPILVEFVSVDDAQVHLTQQANGDANWQLPIAGDTDSDASGDAPGLDILFGHVEVKRSRVVYVTPERDKPLDVSVESMLQQQRDDGFLELDLKATLNDRDVTLSGKIGVWDALLSGKDVRFDLAATLDTFSFTANGRIDDLVAPARPSFSFTASGPDIDDLTRMLGLGEEGEGNIDLTGSLLPQDGGPLVLNAKGNLGKTEIDASGTVSDLQNLAEIGLEANASGPDLGRVLRLAGIHQLRAAPFSLRVDAETHDSGLVVREARLDLDDAVLDATASLPNFPALADATVDLKIKGPDIEKFRRLVGIKGAARGPFSLELTLSQNDDNLDIVRLDAKTSLVDAKVSGRLGTAPEYVGTQLDFDVSVASIAALARAYGVDSRMPDKPAAVSGRAELVAGGIQTRTPVKVKLDDNDATVEGVLQLEAGIRGSSFDLTAKGPDLVALIGNFVDVPESPVRAYDIKGRLQVQDDGLRLRGVNASIGSSTVTVAGLLANSPNLAGTHFDVTAKGPAFEEVVQHIGDIEVHPGQFDMAGKLLLNDDSLEMKGFSVNRPSAGAKLDLKLGLPVSRQWLDFDLSGRGSNVRSIFKGTDSFEIDEQPFSVAVRGERRGSDFSIQKADITVGQAKLSAKGKLALQDRAATTDFSFDGSIPSLAGIGTLDGRRFRDQGAALRGEVKSNSGLLEVENLVATIGASDINGLIRFHPGDVPRVEANLRSDSLVYAPLLEASDEEPVPDIKDGRLIPDFAIPFDAMKKVDAIIALDVKNLKRGELALTDVVLRSELNGGELNVSRIAFKARSGELDASLQLAPAGGRGKLRLKLLTRGFAAGVSELNRNLDMKSDINVSLDATGTDLRSVLGSATGIFLVDIKGGRIGKNAFLQALYGDILDEILNAVNPFHKTDPYTSIECIVMPVGIRNGLMSGLPNSFVSTDKIRMVLKSTVDLKTEKIEVAIRTTPRKKLSISAAEVINPYVKVVGTLAKPALGIDEQGVLVAGGAAVATGGLSILARAAWNRLSASSDPCADARAAGREGLHEVFPELISATP